MEDQSAAVAVETPTPSPEKAGPADSWCNTDLQIVNFSYQWTIKNLEFRCVDSDVILESPPFCCGPETNLLQWSLKLTVYKKSSVSIQLRLVSDSEVDLVQRHQYSVLGHNREILHKTEWIDSSSYVYGDYDLLETSELFNKAKGFLPDGKLTILCEIKVHAIDKYVHINAGSAPKCDLSQHLGSLLETATLSDVTLAVGDKEFKAHKNILSARSPVFRAMFQHDTKEHKENRAQISDCDPDTVEEMLQFIYTGEAPRLKEMTHSLFVIADKYQLERLKKMCEQALWEKLDVQNAVDTLLLAITHDLVELKRSCIRFITTHVSKVMKTEGWENLKAMNTCKILTEIFS